jgi:hypothetical protein
MRKTGKIAATAVLLIFLVSSLAFSQSADLKVLQETAEDFSDSLAKSLPFNASLGLNWSDAYIGQLFPSAPPHFGVGASFGFTTIDMKAAGDLAEALGFTIPFDAKKLLLPIYAGEIRAGGVFFPFDVGLKAGVLPSVGLWGSGINTSYTLIGADLRYALTEGGVILPAISVGVGFNYLKGGLEASVGQQMEYSFDGSILRVTNPDVNLFWSTKVLDFKIQLSKPILIVTPYLGLGLSHAWSEAGYEAEAPITVVSGGGSLGGAQDYLDGTTIDGNKISSAIKVKGFSARVFGGLSVNFTVFKLDLTGMFNFRDSNYGASLGARFQL